MTKTNLDNCEVTVRRHKGTGLLTAEFCKKKGNMGFMFLANDQSHAIRISEALDKAIQKSIDEAGKEVGVREKVKV